MSKRKATEANIIDTTNMIDMSKKACKNEGELDKLEKLVTKSTPNILMEAIIKAVTNESEEVLETLLSFVGDPLLISAITSLIVECNTSNAQRLANKDESKGSLQSAEEYNTLRSLIDLNLIEIVGLSLEDNNIDVQQVLFSDSSDCE